MPSINSSNDDDLQIKNQDANFILLDIIVSLFVYLAQTITSIFLIVVYDDHGPNNVHMLSTAAFTVSSAAAVSVLSTVFYIEDLDDKVPSVSTLREAFRWLCILFGISPLARWIY